jgi:thiamine biosynthesis lipoprotein
VRLIKSNHKPKASKPPFRFEAIGTQWQIDINQSLKRGGAEDLLEKIHQRIEVFDRHYSRFRVDSLVTHMSKQAGTYELPADAQLLLDTYAQLYTETSGAVTPLVGQLLSDAGYDAGYSLQPKSLRPVPTWQEALDYQFPHLTVKQPVLLDFGAVGKGYLVDILGQILEEQGISSFCINAGGDILQHTTEGKSLDIGLENPNDPTQAIGVAKISNQSLCGSAGNRRAWDNYHHIFDPFKRTSPQHIKAIWVTAPTALLADALTTCLFFVPPTTLAEHHTFEYAIIYNDNSLTYSAHFPASFFH